jgi:putative aldouronate transport system substrate-binding protein
MTWDSWNEKNRLWITAGDMPDWIFWDFNFTEYVSYAEQGLLGSLPDGWEVNYPDLSGMIQATGLQDKINLDGKTYVVPKVIFYHFAPIAEAISHWSLFYRDDWRKQLGLAEMDVLITLDQLEEYLKGCVSQGLAPAGLSGSYTAITSLFVSMENSGWSNFYKKNGEYVWGPGQPETLAGIKLFKEYYDKGIINPDFYLNKAQEARNEFVSGLVAMMYNAGSIDNVAGRINEFSAANPTLDAFDVIKITSALGPDGKWHGESFENYWASVLFSPSLDETKMNRIAALFNYIASKEGQELINLGIPEKDWTYSDGVYKILREKEADGSYTDITSVYPSCSLWYILTNMPDDFSFVSPTADFRVVDAVVDMYAAKAARGDILKYDPDYSFFISDAKSAYSVDSVSEIVRIIMKDGADIDAEWAAFVKAQTSMFQPVLDDLNAAFKD